MVQPIKITYEEAKARAHHYLISKTDFIKVKDQMSDDQMRAFVDNAITQMCQENDLMLSVEDRTGLIREIAGSVISLGPLRDLMEDPSVTEIMVNGCNQVYIQRDGRLILTDVKFQDNQHVYNTAQRMIAASGLSKRVDESMPYVDFGLPDGSRVNILLPPCVVQGPTITIRKFKTDINTIDNLIDLKTLNKEMAFFLISAVKARLNMVFCGSTGSGKTTLLNVVSKHIPEDERIITIEDTAELRLVQEHVVNLQAKDANIEGKGAITARDLFRNSLRMRPDRIIVGEIRGNEILDMVQSIASGHSGTLGIVHADSPGECFNRMTTMMLMAGVVVDSHEIQRQISTSVDLIVHTELFMDGVRRVTNITDLYYDPEQRKGRLRDIFKFKQEKVDESARVIGDWVKDKAKPSSYDKFGKWNVRLPEGFFE